MEKYEKKTFSQKGVKDITCAFQLAALLLVAFVSEDSNSKKVLIFSLYKPTVQHSKTSLPFRQPRGLVVEFHTAALKVMDSNHG